MKKGARQTQTQCRNQKNCPEIRNPPPSDQFRLNPTNSNLKKYIFPDPAVTLLPLLASVRPSRTCVYPLLPVAQTPLKNYQTNPFCRAEVKRRRIAVSRFHHKRQILSSSISPLEICACVRIPIEILHGTWKIPPPPLRCSALDVGCSMFPPSKPRYLPWPPLGTRPEYRIGIPCRCVCCAGLSLSLESSQELLKKQFDRIGNRMDHLMIVMAAGKTLIVSSDARGNEVVGCKKLVTRTGVQQPATKPKRQQLYFTHATPLEK